MKSHNRVRNELRLGKMKALTAQLLKHLTDRDELETVLDSLRTYITYLEQESDHVGTARDHIHGNQYNFILYGVEKLGHPVRVTTLAIKY